MILSLMIPLALGAAPAHVDLNDLDHWELTAERFLDGPGGCWEVVGRVSWDWDAGRWGLSRGSAVFASRMEDGVWGEFHVEPLGEVVRERRGAEKWIYSYEPRWAPLFGRMSGDIEVSNAPRAREELPIDQFERDERAEARQARAEARRESRRDRGQDEADQPSDKGPTNAVREGLDRVSGNKAVTSWTQWDDAQQSVVLYRGVPIEDSTGKEAEQTFRFPMGGLPDAMDVAFPEWFTGGMARVRVREAEAHLRVRPSGGELFPSRSAFKLEVGILGFTVKGGQTIAYQSIRPCAIPEQGPELPDAEPTE